MKGNMDSMTEDGLLYSLEVGHSMTLRMQPVEGKPDEVYLDEAGDTVWDFANNHVPLIPEGIEPFTGTYREVTKEIDRLEKIGGLLKQFVFFPHPIAKLAA